MKIKVITSNLGKVAEFQKAFSDLGIEVEHYRMPYDEIQTDDLKEVVAKGIEELKQKGLKNFIIDDSGLFIDELKGFPGVYSAFAQKTISNKGVLKLMENCENRKAAFKCCIGLEYEGKTIIVEGICDGVILNEERGTQGFGFDPIFSVDGNKSFSEIGIDEKNIISHRGIALKLLYEAILNEKLIE